MWWSPPPDNFIEEQVRSLKAVLESVANQDKIFIPPLPRFMFSSCCEITIHAPNTRSQSHSTLALTEHTQQRKTITKACYAKGVKKFKVMDALGTLTPTQQRYSDKATALHKLTHRNNVHLLEKGYTILVERIVADSKAMKEGRTAADATQQQRETGDNGQEMALWGGFFTMVGSHKLPALWLQLGEWPTFSSAFSSTSFSCPHMHSIVNKKHFLVVH